MQTIAPPFSPPVHSHASPSEQAQTQAQTNAQRAIGEGCLSTKNRDGATVIENLHQRGCAKIRVPRSFDGQLEAVTINSSGGMTGGDRLSWSVACGPNTRTTVTTQACERAYRSIDDEGVAKVHMGVDRGAHLSWLPQETILFDGARLRRTIDVDLAEDATALIVEPVIFGRTAMGEEMRQGAFHDSWRIKREGTLVHAEELRLCSSSDGDELICDHLRSPMGGGGYRAFATLLAIDPAAEASLEPCRDVIAHSPYADGGVAVWPHKLVVRLMAMNGYHLRQALVPLIEILNRGGALPKVWNL